MMDGTLQRPITELEAAQLLSTLNPLGRRGNYAPADLLRRLLFERDRLRDELAFLRADASQAATGAAWDKRIADASQSVLQQLKDELALARDSISFSNAVIDQLQKGFDVRVEVLQSGIRLHRDARGDDRCWMDDDELYKMLPEGYTPPERDTTVELALCEKFIACRRNPATEYVSPQRRIEELEDEVARLKEALQ
jgi:hypothetical protein